MDTKDSYKSARQYLAYCRNTDEKTRLQQHISTAFNQDPQTILDLGCGNGLNTVFLADRFPESLVDAIERSKAQIGLARSQNSRPNIRYFLTPLENFRPDRSYNLILASHVLQYIDSDLEGFVRKATGMLEHNGELWLVQQTREGMAEIIAHQKPFLKSPRFNDWKTFEDYEPIIRGILNMEYQITIDHLDSSFKTIYFKNPSEEDKLRLEFIFCLDKTFDEQSPEFKEHLKKLRLGRDGRIKHPNKIMRIKK